MCLQECSRMPPSDSKSCCSLKECPHAGTLLKNTQLLLTLLVPEQLGPQEDASISLALPKSWARTSLIVRSKFISETPAANDFGEVCFPASVIEEKTRPLEEGGMDENGVNLSGLASFYQDFNIQFGLILTWSIFFICIKFIFAVLNNFFTNLWHL